MHRDTFSPPAQLVSTALHIFTRAEARRTHLRWVFTAGKHELLSSHAHLSSGGGESPGTVDKSSARHFLGLCESGSDRPGLATTRILAGVNRELTIPSDPRTSAEVGRAYRWARDTEGVQRHPRRQSGTQALDLMRTLSPQAEGVE